MGPETKACQNCKNDFVIDTEDFNFYKKISVPPPTFCPECRAMRRFSHRNERFLYKRQCDLCKDNIISIYSPKGPYIVYCPKCWHSDKWDQYAYGMDYDFSRNFFEQFIELEKKVPHLALLQENNVNSPWVNYETDDRNCYLNVGGHYNEDSAYNQYAMKSKNCLDNFWMMHGEYSYGNILCENSYKTFYSIFCFENQDTWFSFDCRNCSNVIGCSGLRHKKYHIFNKQVSKEEYEKFVAEYLSGSRDKYNELKILSEIFWKSKPQRALFIERSLNCLGNLIKDSRNCQDAWNVEKSDNIRHAMLCLELKDSRDVMSVWRGELEYEVLGSIYSSKINFSLHILSESTNVYYSNTVFGSTNCFGCSHIKHGEYSILNKKYTKEQYENLFPQIIQHMNDMPFVDRKGRVYRYGEFLPYEASPFSYEESVANEYFSLSVDGIKKEGANLLDYAVDTNYDIEIISPPDSINDVDDSILNKAIKCEETGKLFKITKMELDFYKRFNLPIPTKSPFVRHHQRLSFISEHMKLLERKCGKCNQEIQSVYTEEEFPIVYCEKCYQAEVY
jgi:hypothetical protein